MIGYLERKEVREVSSNPVMEAAWFPKWEKQTEPEYKDTLRLRLQRQRRIITFTKKDMR